MAQVNASQGCQIERLADAPWRSTVTSTRSAILMKGMPEFMPNSLRSNAIVPLT